MLKPFDAGQQWQEQMNPYGPFELLIIQATPFCNIDCSYCYLANRSQVGLIDESTLRNIFSKAFASRHCSRSLCIVWHAGEPLVAPRDFYARAFELCELLRPSEMTATQYIQTNGTLIDEQWCKFFKRSGTRIGLSLDGPKHLHDLNRKTRAGLGTFEFVMRAVSLLQSAAIDFSVISVVTAATLSDAKAFHDFFVEAGIRSIALNIDEIENVRQTSTLSSPGSLERFHKFISELYALSQASGLRIREFQRTESSLRWFLQSGRGPSISPYYPLSFDHRGNFTVFAPELLGVAHPRYGSFTLGNINVDDLDEALDSSTFHRINRDVAAGINLCRTNCAFFGVCGGGSPSNKLFENNRLDSTETLYCRLHIKTIAPIVSRSLLLKATARAAR